jgi:membrane protease YdiL (CAAX protease family)
MLSALFYQILLAAVLAALVWFVRNDRAEYAKFKALTRTEDRQRAYGRWTLKSFLLFGLGALGLLLLLGRIHALWRLPPEFAALGSAVDAHLTGEGRSSGIGVLAGIAAAMVGGSMFGAFAASRRRKSEAPAKAVIRDIDPLFPRNGDERRWTGLLALNSGPSEELFFRLALPLLIASVTHNALLGFAVAAVLFGALHLYQGWLGVLGTTMAGIVFTMLYLGFGTIWVPVVLHSAMNLVSLWLRPWLRRDRSEPGS